MTIRPLSLSTQLIKISSISTIYQILNLNFNSNKCRCLTKDIITRCHGHRTRATVFPIVWAGPKDLIHHRLETSIIFSSTIRTIVTISIKVKHYFNQRHRKYQQHKVVSNSNSQCSQHSFIKPRSETLEWAVTSLNHLNSFHHAIIIDNIMQLLTLLSTVSLSKYNRWTSITTT